MCIEYIALNHKFKLAYELGKFSTVFLLTVPITYESVRRAIDNFGVEDKDEYAAIIFSGLSQLNPDFEVEALDDEGRLLSRYGDYILIGSRYLNIDDQVKQNGIRLNKLGNLHQ